MHFDELRYKLINGTFIKRDLRSFEASWRVEKTKEWSWRRLKKNLIGKKIENKISFLEWIF